MKREHIASSQGPCGPTALGSSFNVTRPGNGPVTPGKADRAGLIPKRVKDLGFVSCLLLCDILVGAAHPKHV